MPYTDRRGRPEIVMHPDIGRGVASYRRETPAEKAAPDTTDRAAAGSATEQSSERAAG